MAPPNNPMPTLTSFCTRLTAALSLIACLLPASLGAQTPPAKEEVIQLSPFQVSASDNQGYGASESMTGSRVATKIADLPFSIGVITSEFFEDFAFFELGDNVAYISAFSDLDQGGSFNLRGIRGTQQLRDGFFRLGRYGSSNIDRIEVIKGPSAALYGATSPGGMVNMISKMPRKQTSQRLSLSVGDWDTRRGTFDATGTVGAEGKTSYITTLGYYDRSTDTVMEKLTNKEAYLAVKHEFSPSSSLTLQGEYFYSRRESPGSSAPLLLDDKNTTSNTDDQIVGIASRLTRLQQTGPEAFLDRGNISGTATYAKTFSPHLSLRVSGNLYHAVNENYLTTVSNGTVNQRTRTITRGNTPEFGAIYEDGGAVQMDLLADYKLGNTSHRTLFTVDFNDYYRDDPAYRVSGPVLTAWSPTTVRNIIVNSDFTGAESAIQYITAPFDITNSTLRRANKNRVTVLGALVRHQASLLNGRLLAFAGGRVDFTRYRARDELPAVPTFANLETSEFTPNFGANFKLTPQVRVFANFSEGFNPNSQGATVANILGDFQPETSRGLDYGFKVGLLDDRLNFTLTAFSIERENVRVDDIDPVTLLPVSNFEGSQSMDGVEFDANWVATDALSFTASFGYIDSQITDLGFRTQSVGRSPARIQPISASFTARYAPKSGALKGFSANLGVIHAGETPISAPDAGDTYTNGVFTRTTNEWALKIPAYTVANAGLRYTLGSERGAKLKHTFGVNVNNVLDKEYIKSSRAAGDRRTFFFNYTLKH
jgi:iron complex outermembrane receptor protein